MYRAAVLICSLVLFAAGAVLAADPAPEAKVYRLQAGDEVSVSVQPQVGYDTAGIILPDGLLYLKKIGKVKALGMTLDELRDYVFKVLDQELNEPEVLVTLSKMAPPPPPPTEKPVKTGRVTLVGAVLKTGPLDLEDGLRIRKALDLAGGTSKEADLTSIVIIHKDLTRTVVDLSTVERLSDPRHNRMLEDGDSIEVKSIPVVEKVVPMVRIRGMVQNPGQYELKPGMTLEDLIVAAGKLAPLADVETVQLQSVGSEIREINLVKQQKLGLRGKVFLKEGDEAFVAEYENRVMLIGAVPQPGPRPIKAGQKVRDFLLNSGDASAFNPAVVNMAGAEIIRRGEQGPIKVNLKSVLKKEDDKDNVALQSGDVLFLPPTKGPKKGPLDFLSNLGPLGFLFGLF